MFFTTTETVAVKRGPFLLRSPLRPQHLGPSADTLEGAGHLRQAGTEVQGAARDGAQHGPPPTAPPGLPFAPGRRRIRDRAPGSREPGGAEAAQSNFPRGKPQPRGTRPSPADRPRPGRGPGASRRPAPSGASNAAGGRLQAQLGRSVRSFSIWRYDTWASSYTVVLEPLLTDVGVHLYEDGGKRQ